MLKLLLVLPLFANQIKVPEPPARLDNVRATCTVIELAEEEPEIEKNVFTMSVAELDALSLTKKAKLIHMNKKTFKTFVKLVNRESGPKLNDKILVAAVVWNRKYCKDYPNTVRKVMYQGGQFTLKGQKKTVIHGNHNDRDAQLAILLAYRMVKSNQIPHNVKNFNSISYRYSDSKRFKKYKHYNNYFVKDTRCKCAWCTACS